MPPAHHISLVVMAKKLHQANKIHLIDISWPRKVAPILQHLQLDTLIINIDCSKYEDDCCTLYADAVMALAEVFALRMPKKLEVFGISDLVDADYSDPAE